MSWFDNLFGTKNKTDFKSLVKEGAVIVDVRTAGEYNSGHIPGSVNIELDKLNQSVSSLQKKNKPVIAVCRSGNRSGMAIGLLKAAGIEAYNGGAWDDLQKSIA